MRLLLPDVGFEFCLQLFSFLSLLFGRFGHVELVNGLLVSRHFDQLLLCKFLLLDVVQVPVLEHFNATRFAWR